MSAVGAAPTACVRPEGHHDFGVAKKPEQGGEREMLGELLQVLDRLPFVSNLRKDITSLRDVIYKRRAPRLAVVGTTGSGKSRLLNALLAKPALLSADAATLAHGRWGHIDAAGSRIDWLEVEADAPPTADELSRSLGEAPPDVVLYVARVGEVDDGLAPGLETLGALMNDLAKTGAPKPPLVAVLTQIDRLPLRASMPDATVTTDLEEQRIRKLMTDRALAPDAVVSIAAPDLVEAGPIGAGVGLDALAELLVGKLPGEAQLEAARALVHAKAARKRVATSIVYSTSALALTVGLMPVPLSDVAIIAPLQMVMVSSIAHLGGSAWDAKAIAQWLASMGVVGTAGLGFRFAAQQLVKLIPGAGTLVSGGVAGAGTAALGRSAVAWFIDRGAR